MGSEPAQFSEPVHWLSVSALSIDKACLLAFSFATFCSARAHADWALAHRQLAQAAAASVPTPLEPDTNTEPDLAPSWTVPVVHGLSLMTAMRIGEAVIWPDPFADLDLDRIGKSYARAFSEPPLWDSSASAFEWDGDPWWLNTGGHALFGSEIYVRARICGRNVAEALLLTTAGSTLWEYGFEANAVQPSAFDLVYTPIAGLLLGEARHALWSSARRLESRAWRSALTTVFDPLGELERALGTRC